MNHTIDYDAKGYTGGVNEMAYYTLYSIGLMYHLMGDFEKAIESHMLAEPFCDFRNEHIVGLAECYRDIGDYESMRYQTERLVDPERKLPFPQCYFLVNNSFYIDSGNYGKELHQVACQTL